MQFAGSNSSAPSLPPEIEAWRQKLLDIKQAWTEYTHYELYPKSLPYRLSIELTQNCNFRCRMCPQSMLPQYASYRPEFNMPINLFEKIANEAFPLATTVDMRGFGETTLLPYWPDVVEYLKRFPFTNWHLITNLSFPKADVWEKMIQIGFEIGFSCDGATKETFEFIRRNGNFDRVLANLEIISNAIKNFNKGNFYFLTTVQKRNVHELSTFIDLASRFGFKEIQFKTVQGSDQKDLYGVGKKEIRDYVTKAVDSAIEKGVSISFNDHFFTQDIPRAKMEKIPKAGFVNSNFGAWPPPNQSVWDNLGMTKIFPATLDTGKVSMNQKCFKALSYVHFDYKGDVGTCNHMMYPDMYIMGNIGTKSLKDIWLSEKYVDFRGQLLNATPQDKRCQWCFKHRMAD